MQLNSACAATADSTLRWRMFLRINMHSYVSQRIDLRSIFVDITRFEDHNDSIEDLSP